MLFAGSHGHCRQAVDFMPNMCRPPEQVMTTLFAHVARGFWTYHPTSPFYVQWRGACSSPSTCWTSTSWGRRRQRTMPGHPPTSPTTPRTLRQRTAGTNRKSRKQRPGLGPMTRGHPPPCPGRARRPGTIRKQRAPCLCRQRPLPGAGNLFGTTPRWICLSCLRRRSWRGRLPAPLGHSLSGLSKYYRRYRRQG